MAFLTDPSAWIAFATLTVLEVVLGFDNVLLLSMLVARLPPDRRQAGRIGGLGLAMVTRIALLLSVVWLTTLDEATVGAAGYAVSVRGLVLGVGGAFLLWKAATELLQPHASAQLPADAANPRRRVLVVILQIALLDVVFSIDSVLTAVGLSQSVPVMAAAIVASVVLMMFVARPIGQFIERHPDVRVLALACLLLVGAALEADAFGVDVPKSYLYCSMGFAFAVELLKLRTRSASAARDPKLEL